MCECSLQDSRSCTISDTALKICVSDNGSGMPPEAAERLFDRYYCGTHTAQKTQGSGLGLVIARALIGNSEIFFADEPTGNLDSRTGAFYDAPRPPDDRPRHA